MIAVLEILFPVFALGLLGFAAARLQAYPAGAMEGMTRFIFNIAAPVAVVRVLTQADLPDAIPWGLLGSFYIPLFGLYFLTAFVCRRAGVPAVDSVMMGYGGTYGNLVLVGLPVMMLVFGDQGLVPYFIIMPVHGVSMMVMTAVIVESVRAGPSANRLGVARQVAVNPFVVGVIVGLTLRHFDIQLVGPLEKLALSLQQALTPCALFTLGVSQAATSLGGHWRTVIPLVVMKNIGLPLCVFALAYYVFDQSPLWTAVLVLTAAQPTGVLYFVFASRFGCRPERAASVVSASTAFSLISLPVLVWIFRFVGVA